MKSVSHTITGIISFILAIYLSVSCFELFGNGLYWDEFVFFIVILLVMYLLIFYPIDFVCTSIEHIENGDLAYGIKNYLEDNKIKTDERYHSDRGAGLRIFVYLYFLAILSLVNIILVLPTRCIMSLKHRN